MNPSTRTFFPVLALAATLPCQWQEQTPASNPGPLSAMAMAANPAGLIVVSGGDTGTFPTPFSTATWLYSQGTWTQSPATGPSGRFEAQMVHDALRQRWVLYGGWTSPFSIGSGNDETWEFDGAAWSQIATANTPGGFWKHAMSYDVLRGVTVLFGGATNGLPGATDGTYEYDGTDWTQRTPTTTPGWRENHSMCFHTNLGATVMFGGFDPLANSVQNETWTWNGTDWSLVTPVGPQPPARASAELVYDSVRGVSVLHGGNDNSGAAFDDTWEFDGATWTQVPGTGPGNRAFGAAFDAGERVVVRYGGIGHTSETWTFGATARTFGTGCAGSNGVPALDAVDAPRLGQNLDLTLANLNPAITVGVFALSLATIAPTPLDPIGMPGCTGYVAPDLLLNGTAAGGTATLQLPLPGTQALIGTSIFAQGLSFDPGINAAWLAASNAFAGVIGS